MVTVVQFVPSSLTSRSADVGKPSAFPVSRVVYLMAKSSCSSLKLIWIYCGNGFCGDDQRVWKKVDVLPSIRFLMGPSDGS